MSRKIIFAAFLSSKSLGVLSQEPPTCYPSTFTDNSWDWNYDSVSKKWFGIATTFPFSPLDWSSGQSACSSSAGQEPVSSFAELITTEENQALAELLDKPTYNSMNFWLSGKASSNRFNWYWTSDPEYLKKITWFNWDDNEPNAALGKTCIAFNSQTGKWLANDCQEFLYPVCQVQCPDIPMTTPNPDLPDYPPRPDFTGQGSFFEWFWKEDEESPLEKYVNTPDPNYSWTFKKKLDWSDKDTIAPSPNFEGYYLHMTSQQWLTPEIVSRSVWEHEIFVFVPKTFNQAYNDSAIIYINGGSNSDNPDKDPSIYYELQLAMKITSDLGIVMVVIEQIPNESLRFYDDHYQDKRNFPDPPSPYDKNDPDQKPLRRSEDSIIAYTWWKYLKNGGKDEYNEWLLRFPMTKAVSRGMDAVSEFMVQQFGPQNKLDKWMIAGASKRGWTTWTVGAADKRVVGMAPLVMDLGRLNTQMHSHFTNLGGWTFAFEDYYFENITVHVDTYEMGEMCKHIDPWSYRYKYRDRDIPIYVVNSAGDEFFLVDDNVQYMQQMKDSGIQDNRIFQRYFRNAEHSLALHGLTNQHIIQSLEDFAISIFSDQPLPKVHFVNKVVDETNRQGEVIGVKGILRVESDTKPENVDFFFGRTQSRKRRDFRLVYNGCLERNETSGNRWDNVNCDCPEITKFTEENGDDIKGICPQFLFWTLHRENAIFKQAEHTKLTELKNGGDKYEFAWEAEIVSFNEDNYFRGAFLEFKFPGVDRPILVGKDGPLDDNPRRGPGLTVNGQALVIPLEHPNPDCTQETCMGTLV